MKSEKLHIILFMLLFFSFSITSCVSAGQFLVPNEREVILKNLSAEYVSVADAYSDLKKYPKAVEFYKKALAIDTENRSIMYSLAKAYMLNKQWNEADVFFDLILQDDPDNSTILLYLAYVSAENDNLEKAVSIYEKLYNVNPYNLNVLTNYGLILVHLEQYDKADLLCAQLTELSETGEGTKKLTKALEDARKSE